MERIITVTGIGTASAMPDMIIIGLSLDIVESEYDKSMEVAAHSLSALREAIAKAGLNRKVLKTLDVKVDAKYDHYRDKRDVLQQRFVGYMCTHKLRIELDFDMSVLGKTLKAIAECKVTPQLRIQFSVKNPGAVSEQLLESAIKDAERKAIALAEAAGAMLGAVLCIDYKWDELHLYSKTDMDAKLLAPMMSHWAETMEIEPDDIDIQDNVTVVWALE